MANWGVNLAEALSGLGEGFDAGQRAGVRQLQANKLKREDEKEREWNKILNPDQAQEKKGWLGRLADDALSAFRRAVPGGGSSQPEGSVRGGTDLRVADVRGGGEGGTQFGVRPDQQEVGEGVSRSAFGYGPGGNGAGAIPPGPETYGDRTDVSGSSGAVPPPGVQRSAAPSPQSVAIANQAVVRAGGKPAPVPPGMPPEAAPPVGYGSETGGRPRTTLSPDEEQRFQQWYRGWAEKAGIDPNPDNPNHQYDYRGAYKAGATPQPDPTDGGRLHWPSQFKDQDHPNRFVGGVDTITGQPRSRGVIPEQPPGRQEGQQGGLSYGGGDVIDLNKARAERSGAPGRPPGQRQGEEHIYDRVLTLEDVRQGAVPTPADQKRDAEITRLANRPKPPGQQPPDLIKAITKGKPEGTLPSEGDLRTYLDKIPQLMKIDPERALRLQAGIFEALRTGTQHGFMQAQIALETGDLNRAQKIAMQTYNKYIAPVSGDYAQFDVKGNGLTMQQVSQQTGKPEGKPIPVTQEMLTKLTLMATDPKSYAQWLHWKDQIDVTKRGQDMAAASAAASRAEARADRREAREQAERHFNATLKLQNDRLVLDMQREDRTAAAQTRTQERQEKLADMSIRKGERVEAEEKAGREGKGYWNPQGAEKREITRQIDETFESAIAATPKAQRQALEAAKGQLSSDANNLMTYNSGMTAAQALDVARKMRSGAPVEKIDENPDYVTLKVGNVEFAVPPAMMRQAQPATGGTPTTAPTTSTTPGTTPPQGAGVIPAAPARPISSGLPSTPPATTEELRGRVQQRDLEADKTKAFRQQERQQEADAWARVVPETRTGVQNVLSFRGRDREAAIQTEARRIAQQTGYRDVERIAAQLRLQLRALPANQQ